MISRFSLFYYTIAFSYKSFRTKRLNKRIAQYRRRFNFFSNPNPVLFLFNCLSTAIHQRRRERCCRRLPPHCSVAIKPSKMLKASVVNEKISSRTGANGEGVISLLHFSRLITSLERKRTLPSER